MKKNLTLMFVTLIAFVSGLFTAHAEYLTVFDGTQVSVYVPLPTAEYNESGTRGQIIYPADELTPMVGHPINGMTLYVNDEGCKMNGGAMRVSMGEVADTTVFTSETYFTGLTQVAVAEMKAGEVEIDIDFATPYVYNGGNLVIEFYVQVAGESGQYNFTYFYGLFQQGHTALSGGEYREFIPKTTFEYGEPAQYYAKTSPRYLNFSTIRTGEHEEAMVSLKNRGHNAFVPTVAVNAPFSVMLANSSSLQPGSSVEIAVSFNPTAAGTFEDVLAIDCGEAGVLEVPLTGTALENGENVTVCDGAATNQYVPFNGIYADDVNTLGQMIYPAEKLTALKGGKIFALTFYTTSIINMKNVVLELSMMNTDKEEFDQATPITGLTAVATANVIKGETEITFEFDSPFEYTGGNLAIETKVTGTGWTATTYFQGEQTDNYASLSCYTSWSGDKKDRYKFLPKATFLYQGGSEPSVIRGDVNMDGTVSISDVTALIDILLGGVQAPVGADCNQDNEVSIGDVTVLIDYLLTGVWPE